MSKGQRYTECMAIRFLVIRQLNILIPFCPYYNNLQTQMDIKFR